MPKTILLLLSSLLCYLAVSAQDSVSTEYSSPPFIKKSDLLVFPIVFYSPETRWAGGAASILAFRFGKDRPDTQVSNIQIGAAYTQEQQLLFYLPYRIFFQNEGYLSYGELGYYRYRYFFFGINNHDPGSEGELYDVNFPRIRINFLKKIRTHLYGGLFYGMDDFDVTKRLAGGLLDDKNTSIPGNEGGRVSSLGLISVWDSRDILFYPTSGMYVEGSFQVGSSLLGSDFSFSRYYLDYRTYLEIMPKHILALNFYGEYIGGTTGFTSLALLGGNRRMRGYYEGKFRGEKLALLQAEYRLPLFWRFKLAVFGSLGGVSPSISEFQPENFHAAYGAGLRFLLSEKENIHVRLDLGIGEKNNSGIYLAIGEAF
ncbi:MAG: BamA/TamA family outer membrane protein [Bacteroidota bacterium]